MEANYQQQQQQGNEDGGAAATTGNKSSSYLCRQSSARWIPTGDQIRILRDLYYNYGVRSPSAEQIQRISAKLRQYGKIEGKNVFYWFQNHKARERHKKRLTADISTPSAITKLAPASMASYDPAQFSPTGALIGERNFRGYCIPGGGGMEVSESGVGWFGLETAAFQVAPWPYHCSIAGHEMVAPEASARPIETLPLFPIHAEQETEEQALENSFYCGGMAGGLSQEDSVNGYHHFLGGRGGASLELTLNSYYYEHPSSM